MSTVLKCILVDDEPPAIRLLEKFVEKIAFLDCIGTFTSAIAALKAIEENDIDVVFLDIQMPEITGIQLSKIIGTKVKVIFTTAYPQFAIEGFELNAVDYLLKPISFERFYTAALKIKEMAGVTKAVLEDDIYFFLKTDGKNNFKKVMLNDINYIEGSGNYVSVYINLARVITHNTLLYFKENLPASNFVQIHKSFIVSLRHVSKIENDVLWIGDVQLPIGNTFKKNFFNRIAEKRI